MLMLMLVALLLLYALRDPADPTGQIENTSENKALWLFWRAVCMHFRATSSSNA
jgi:hypothetical protein